MRWGLGGIGHAFWPLHMILWLLIMGLLIWGLVRLFSSRNRWMATCYPDRQQFYSDRPPLQPSALEILRQRYARGEIDAATFDQMLERLESSGRPRE